MRPGGVGISRMMLRAVTLLPEPDSPTMPSVSPRLMWKSIPSTARTTPSSVKKYVFSPLTSSSRSAMTPPLARYHNWLASERGLDHRLASPLAAARTAAPRRPPARTTGVTDSPRGARRRASAAAARLALPSTGDLAERLERALDVLGVDGLVGGAADRGRPDRVDLHLPRGALRHELARRRLARTDFPWTLDAEDDDVRLDGHRVDGESRQPRDALGEPAGVGVVLRQPVHHPVERADPRGGEGARLPHAAAHHLAHAPGPRDEVARGPDHRAHGRPQPLRQAEGHRVRVPREVARRAP